MQPYTGFHQRNASVSKVVTFRVDLIFHEGEPFIQLTLLIVVTTLNASDSMVDLATLRKSFYSPFLPLQFLMFTTYHYHSLLELQNH